MGTINIGWAWKDDLLIDYEQLEAKLKSRITKNLHLKFLSLLAGLWRTVSWPVVRLLCAGHRPCPSSPVLPRTEDTGASSDWEDRSSLRALQERYGADEEEEEEDVFGTSSETGPRHSGFSPDRGSPFPREHRSLCGNGLYSVEDVNACPTSTPRHTSDGGRSVWKGSPNVSGISQDSPGRVYPPAAHHLKVEDEGQAAGTALFMPRNLLSLFDQSMECD
ncbi:uncharacterized protein LOC122559958 [Chiloscyllium plagiosum]|uniref:uncharacterized protein LOC122559958 n=1 Tax=Chiloscyllium plagiosum TaxID=36176 RepID=UPI001CB87B48|nr:uncharacterized protein LOC122559958 [Chiloscyllium plagiosum]